MGRRSPDGKKLTWPRQLQAIVETYGAERVFLTGLDALGYPPTWAHTNKEALAVQKELSK